MNDEYEERGWFKELVLIAFLAFAWLSEKAERAWKNESFWIVCSALSAIVAIYCMIKLLVRAVS
jgi:hypothetical protein